MSSTNTARDELRQILMEYCYNKSNISDTESAKKLLTKVSEDLSYELLDSDGCRVLAEAADRGHTELCVTLLSSLPSADRLKLILLEKFTALHWAALSCHSETVSGILNCLTADQQLQLLFKQDIIGNTALHYAALSGSTETVKTLLDNLTPEQQLKLLSVLDHAGKTASKLAAASKHNKIEKMLKKYERDADFEVNYGKWEHSNVMTENRGLNLLS